MNFKYWILLLTFSLISCVGDSSSEIDTVDVYISKGDTQCNDDGLTIEETISFLTTSGIEVSESQCGVISDLSYPAVCGGGTNNIYIHTIEIDDLGDAENLGFTDTSLLITEESSYSIVECE
ncbi:hypothetical protein ACLKMH_18380 [Psychromonas sp. KJ10-10]|uniref:hypothetical protein n=1 Tax=Psychromonas sp. KJ10-10 TaxID=3391823 RepID=UPI0039B6648F